MLDKKLTNEEKLDLIYQMTEENHDILMSLRRQSYVSNAFKLLYWLVILGAIGGAYYYVRPAINYVSENSTKFEEVFNQLQGVQNALPEAQLLNGLIDGLKKSATGGQ
ncbi:MAG: hypothetical protein KBC21_03785 [Candidatus Pacebacteria bacterium]|nr:hypothetical protein [Candidatus Paceibacterota bacterium]